MVVFSCEIPRTSCSDSTSVDCFNSPQSSLFNQGFSVNHEIHSSLLNPGFGEDGDRDINPAISRRLIDGRTDTLALTLKPTLAKSRKIHSVPFPLVSFLFELCAWRRRIRGEYYRGYRKARAVRGGKSDLLNIGAA